MGTHYDQQQVDPYAGYNSDLTSAYSNTIAEKQDELDMDVILPIVVFGGLGLGAIAYIDSLNRQRDLCNKLAEVTNVARTGNNPATVTLVAEATATGTGGAGTQA